MQAFLESIGNVTLRFFGSVTDVFRFIGVCFWHMLLPSSYNPATIMVLIKQIYFTAVGILPLFLTMSIIFGSIIIGVVVSLSAQYGLQDRIGRILVAFSVDEFAPFFTALLISLRSSTAVNTEIATMKVNHELNTLKEYRIDIIDYLFVPRIVSGIVSMVSLSILFAIIMLASGYIFVHFYLGMDLHSYKLLLLHALQLKDILILVLKGVAFGFVTMVIPIYSGLQAFNSYTAIPISVLNGMVKLFIALFVIEVTSLLLQSL